MTDSPLLSLTDQEWESLCDGCGRCCLVKLQDEETDELYFTSLACRFFDCQTCRCTVYPERSEKQPECIVLTRENLEVLKWMPTTCAYRRYHEGDTSIFNLEEVSVSGRVIHEHLVEEDQHEDHIIHWIHND